ncbi:MAG: helix-turn-helix domain-containing protein, partial [Candidatus Nanohalobium sp.]
TRHKWVHQYSEAGLLHFFPDKTERQPQHQGMLTERGEAFINTTEALNKQVFSDLDIEAGDFYRKMFTQGYRDREAHSGDKIQAFFLYGAGMSHSEVSEDLDVPESTVRSMANYLEEEGLFTEDNMFTPEGRDLADFVLCQLDDAEPEEFDGGSVRTNLGQREDDFFDDDGMLDM